VGAGDVTTEATVPAQQAARGVFLVKASCVLAGIGRGGETFRQLEPGVEVVFARHDGDRCAPGKPSVR